MGDEPRYCKDCQREIINEACIKMNYNPEDMDIVDREIYQCMDCYSAEMDYYEYGGDDDYPHCNCPSCTYAEEYERDMLNDNEYE
jgi:hypothetical protein